MAIVSIGGAGGLTLGMLCPVAFDAGNEPLVLSRISGSDQQSRLARIAERQSIVLADLDGQGQREIPIRSFIDIGIHQGLDTAQDVLSDNKTAVYVTAAREGFGSLQEVLLTARDARNTTMVALCTDNSPPPSWETLRALPPDPRLVIREAVADRICVRFPDRFTDIDVVVETEFSWWIEPDDQGILERTFMGVAGVHFVDDISTWRSRKLLCMNGLHLALGLSAWLDGEPLLDDWVKRNWDSAQSLADSIARAYAASTGDDTEKMLSYCSNVLTRAAAATDRSGRMLGLKANQLSGDPDDLRRRVDERLLPLVGWDRSDRIESLLWQGRGLAEQWAR